MSLVHSRCRSCIRLFCIVVGIGVLAAGCTSAQRTPPPEMVSSDGAPLEDPLPRAALMANGERMAGLPTGSYRQGKEHLLAGRYGLAVHVLRQALAADPGSTASMNALAIAYGRVGREDLSLRWFERALQVDPGSLHTLNNIGFWALERGQLDLARRYLSRAYRIAPHDTRIAANLDLLGSLVPGGHDPFPAPSTEPVPIIPDGPARPARAYLDHTS
jgi:Tetratricopeptide repeat